MKRQGRLFEQITGRANIRLAFLKALRGNRASPQAVAYCQNIDANLALLREKLQTLSCGWGGYHTFPIFDPKPRVISTAPFEQRIMHHAIMNILEPLLERPLIHHSYACRKGKGTHAAVLYAFRQCKAHPYFLKLDIRKYFDSIDHETLKVLLRRRIKDERVIVLLDGIIDSYETMPGKGLPIGNLTSQFFANMYLAGLDHYILEKLHPSAYCRYMDDFVLWASSHAELVSMYARIDAYVNETLRLSLKQAVYGNAAAGLPFLGFLIKESGVYLLRRSKKRVSKRMREITVALRQCFISELRAAGRARSTLAAIRLARTNRLRKWVCGEGSGNGV
jgi:RNA-directed DNA polymerase